MSWWEQAYLTLSRAPGLYGPSPSGADGLTNSGAALTNAANTRYAVGTPGAPDSGRAQVRLVDWNQNNTPGLNNLGAADQRVQSVMQNAAGVTGDGRQTAGNVVTTARGDAAALAPWSQLPAAERALLLQMRARLMQQQQLLRRSQAQARALAAQLRNARYGSPAGKGMAGLGGMPQMGSPGGKKGGGGGLSALSGLGGLPNTLSKRRAGQRTMLAGSSGAANIPAGPGGQAVAAALTRRGAPYVWGAKGPTQFDCSGLTQWAWKQAGLQLGPDTYTQIKQGVRVPPGQVRAGDLIFPHAGHVMLAVSGDSVIHAPQSGDVVRLAPMPGSFTAIRPGA